MSAVAGALHGWWRVVETSQWVDDGLDILGPALISFTGDGARLRMHCLLGYVNVRSTKTDRSGRCRQRQGGHAVSWDR